MDFTWKDLIIRHFGRKMRSKIQEFRLNILAVDVGLKPGYLFDFGVQNVSTISSFLKDLDSHNLIGNRLMAVRVDMDFLVVNNRCVSEVYDNKEAFFRFVDVSPHLTAPMEITEGSCIWREDLFNIVRTMNSHEDDHIFETDSLKSLNMTSLFGILLGYPNVYWYETDSDDSGNCLCMESIHHYEIIGKTDQGFKHVIYSFSSPSSLGELTDHIEKWFVNLKNSKTWNSIFTEIYFEKNTVMLPIVTL